MIDIHDLRMDRDFVAITNADPPCGQCPELFFEPDERESTKEKRFRERAAAAVCRRCPVDQLCLSYALRTRPQHGIHAGNTPRQIAALARQDHAAA